MTRRIVGLALAAALAALAQPVAANDVSDALAAGIVGVAVGAALSKSGGHHSGSRQFSPTPGITCHPKHRACYHDDGGFAAKWTDRIYG